MRNCLRKGTKRKENVLINHDQYFWTFDMRKRCLKYHNSKGDKWKNARKEGIKKMTDCPDKKSQTELLERPVFKVYGRSIIAHIIWFDNVC